VQSCHGRNWACCPPPTFPPLQASAGVSCLDTPTIRLSLSRPCPTAGTARESTPYELPGGCSLVHSLHITAGRGLTLGGGSVMVVVAVVVAVAVAVVVVAVVVAAVVVVVVVMAEPPCPPARTCWRPHSARTHTMGRSSG
jgi:hypothetical protein